MKKLLSILVILLFAACSKKDVVTDALTTGTLSGTISPAGAAIEVNIVASINGQPRNFIVQPDASGRFTFRDLLPGTYMVTFTATPGYYAPNVLQASIIAGREEALGNISFLDMSKTSSISGDISPLNAASYVIATREDSPANIPEIFATVNSYTGTFEMPRVLPGKYTLTFGSNLGFAIDPVKSVMVTVDQRTTVGTVSFRNSATGSISGTVYPASEVLQIWANYVGAFTKVYTVKPESDGKFKINNVSPGNYFVAATTNTASSFFAPYSRYYTVTENQDTNVGSITLTNTAPPLPVSCKINNVLNQATYATAILSPGRLTISTSLNGLSFAITLNNFIEVADRTYTSSTGSVIFLGERKKQSQIGISSLGYEKLWYANNTGTIRITSIDPLTKTISGTFSGTMTESKDINNVKTISEGAFTNLQYR